MGSDGNLVVIAGCSDLFRMRSLIGFFLWLIALGYGNPRMAKATTWGIGINLALAVISAYYAFIAIP
jgi:hypothetical protein